MTAPVKIADHVAARKQFTAHHATADAIFARARQARRPLSAEERAELEALYKQMATLTQFTPNRLPPAAAAASK